MVMFLARHPMEVIFLNSSARAIFVTAFNTRNLLLTQKLLKQGNMSHKLRKTFFKILPLML